MKRESRMSITSKERSASGECCATTATSLLGMLETTRNCLDGPLIMLPCTYRDFDVWLIDVARNLPCLMNKESQQQKDAQAAQTQFTKQLTQIYNTQFGEQQQILKVLTPQLEAMAASPQGVGATEYAALQSGIITGVAQQFQNVAKQEATNFATQNEAGLPSGVEAQVQANLKAAAAGAQTSQLSNLAIQNEQLKQQQQQFALGNLLNLNTTTGSQMGTTGGQAGHGLQEGFQNATTIYNQGSLWKNILGGIAGAGLGALTGGFSSVGTALGSGVMGSMASGAASGMGRDF